MAQSRGGKELSAEFYSRALKTKSILPPQLVIGDSVNW